MKAKGDKWGAWVRWVAVAAGALVLLWSAGCQMGGGGARTFAVTFGGDKEAKCARQTRDGGYIVAGYTISSGPTDGDGWLIKTDPSGTEAWSRAFGGEDVDIALSVWPTQDGGYILAGETLVSNIERDGWLTKTDASGEEVWNRTFDDGQENLACDVQQTPDGGYIVVGQRDQDSWVMKTDPSGEEAWSRTFGQEGKEGAYRLEVTRDGGCVVAGWTKSMGAGGGDGLLIKLDASGKVMWSRTFGGPNTDGFCDVVETRDRGFVIAGYSESAGAGGADAWLIRTDTLGNEVWSRTFGGPDTDSAECVQQTRDGGYIVVGATKSFGAGDFDAWLIRVDRSGRELWSRTFGGPKWDCGVSVQQTRDGGYIVAADTESFGTGSMDAWLIKTDSKGMVREGP